MNRSTKHGGTHRKGLARYGIKPEMITFLAWGEEELLARDNLTRSPRKRIAPLTSGRAVNTVQSNKKIPIHLHHNLTLRRKLDYCPKVYTPEHRQRINNSGRRQLLPVEFHW